MSKPVWKSEKGRERLVAWYERFLERAGVPTERRHVQTSHGESHVLLAGNPGGPPLVCLHAMRTSSAHLLGELGALHETFRLILPDLPGQSVKAPPVSLSLKDDSQAKWLLEVVDGLGVGQFHLFGVSWGGFVARQTASFAPERVLSLTLLVPAAIANGDHVKGLTRLAMPMLRYKLRPSDSNLRRFLDPLLTTWDDDWGHYLGDALHDLVLDLRIPPLASDDALRRLSMPALVIGAADDISFPGEKIAQRVRASVPDADVEVIQGKHCPPTTHEFHAWLSARVKQFIER